MTSTPSRGRPGRTPSVRPGRTPRLPLFLGITVTPVVAMVVLGVLFADALAVPGDGSYRTYLVAGVAAQTGLLCVGPTLLATVADRRSGLVLTFRAMVVRVVTGLGVAAAALAVMTVVALAIGWRPDGSPGRVLAAYGLLLALYGAMSWFGVVLGLLVVDPKVLRPVGVLAVVALAFVSNAFVSPDLMPAGARRAAEWNPLSAVATTCRAWWGNPTGTVSQAWPVVHPHRVALVFVVGLAVVSAVAAALLARSATRPGRVVADQRPDRAGPTLVIARASARHPGWAVVGWVALVGLCVGVGQLVGLVSATPTDLANGDSHRAAAMADEAGLTEDATEYVLVGPGPHGTADPARLQSVAADLTQALDRSPIDRLPEVVETVERADPPRPTWTTVTSWSARASTTARPT